jgi:hypothetical protein
MHHLSVYCHLADCYLADCHLSIWHLADCHSVKHLPESFIGIATNDDRNVLELSGLEELLGKVGQEVAVDRRQEGEEVERIFGDRRLKLDDFGGRFLSEARQRRLYVARVEIASNVFYQFF